MPPKQLPYYEMDGVRYPRVSAILSILRDPDLEAWQAKVGDKAAEAKRKHAEKIGLTLDAMIKQDVQGAVVKWPKPTSAEVKQGWKAWQEYKRLYSAPDVGFRLVRPEYGYGGEPDLLERDTIIDLKATTRLREKHWVQLTAYVPLWWPEERWPSITLRLVRLDTFLGTCEVKERPFVRQIWETFLHLKQVYQDWYGAELNQEVLHGASH